MVIDFSKLSDNELLSLIREAVAELETRVSMPRVERVPARDRPVIALREPPDHEKDFCLMVKTRLRRGEYIKADERRQVAEMAAQYPEWVKRQGLPTESGTGAWRRAKEFHSIPRADER